MKVITIPTGGFTGTVANSERTLRQYRFIVDASGSYRFESVSPDQVSQFVPMRIDPNEDFSDESDESGESYDVDYILASGSRHSHELASELGADHAAVYRFLRALASMDVLQEVEPGRFRLSFLGDYVRTDHADAFHEVVRWNALEWELWSRFEQSVLNGKSAFENVHGVGVFDYLTDHPEYGRYFDRAMSEFVAGNTAAIVVAYPFALGETVVDVGGGSGALLSAILRANPSLRGVVFDLPETAESAAASLADPEIYARCEYVGGSFFDSVPSGGDAYILSSILHDWDDDRCRTILGKVRSAMSDRSRLVISELLVPDGTEASPIKVFDLNMLVLTSGGRERTRAEFASLLDAAGLRLERVVPTQTAVSLLEAVPRKGTAQR